ncbi:MAG TPA: Crp/Fnr family transcriptional regulator [Candidatus Eisenbacteria bacterium]|nr:Crp/Fnr family transcriptional regulator [Candidatus Eisenbacteria bacterium]
MTYKPGRILIEEGLVNDKIIFISQGLVKIYKLTSQGKEIFLALEKTNDILGVMDLHNKPASATIEALQPTRVLVFHKKDLIALLQTNPFLWERMYNVILAKLEDYRELQSIRLGNDLYQRTYLLLTFLSQFLENKTITLSQEALANIVGATRPRVTEVLHLLRNAKKISMSSKKITLLA